MPMPYWLACMKSDLLSMPAVCEPVDALTESLPPLMYIGALARLTGASVKAIRLYESMGLLGVVPRQGVYRVYRPRHVAQVRLVRQALALGIRLSALRQSLGAGPGAQPDWDAVAQQIAQRRKGIASEMDRLQRLDAVLQDILTELQTCTDTA